MFLNQSNMSYILHLPCIHMNTVKYCHLSGYSVSIIEQNKLVGLDSIPYILKIKLMMYHVFNFTKLTRKSRLYFRFLKSPPTIAARWITCVGLYFSNIALVASALLEQYDKQHI